MNYTEVWCESPLLHTKNKLVSLHVKQYGIAMLVVVLYKRSWSMNENPDKFSSTIEIRK